ncbi:segregation/condensation protein A [Patescibacteria group bacterium]|jgi:segregation and condensation protein A|uniref:Segregation and condensation protein A n=1 Tax=candidate division WWE3 bacterium TaxID=2053526 RepID=A0A928Y6H9_UNCKA|nr:segregation/condensation protein A [candidate division WWE3 bacterium]MCL4732782.1 segregation/condensation protein A [Patescibacteria group bacterium]MDL1952901.1 hypothetical protein [Candidatus Uhrbacteria bacterium UHB]RIL00621.1 MAG: hypothetical protein DCC77_03670 [Candidatus Uhrbacteria bacterium]
MSVTFRIEAFEGPLDLLLQLIEREELEITDVSLSVVADQFIQHVQAEQENILPEELADFLVIAARLVYMKSKAILPGLLDEDLEEGPDLASQLRLYQRFVSASKWIDERWNEGMVSFPREKRPLRSLETSFAPPPGVSAQTLRDVMEFVLKRLTPIVKLPEAAVRRVVTIQEKIRDLAERLRSHAKLTFSGFLKKSRDKSEAVISFLALLELVKQRVVNVEQKDLFEDISIAANDLEKLADLKIEFV